MNASFDSAFQGDSETELLGLIESLAHIEQRLETLTAGEVDTVADSRGHTFLLRRAQEELRRHDAEKQAAILNVLPAHIALIDTAGKIVSINASWLASANVHPLQGPGYDIGFDYVGRCDAASPEIGTEAHKVAAGIRGVLRDGQKSFSIEYDIVTASDRHCYLLTVTPLADSPPTGAVVMHLDITERKLAEQGQRDTQSLLAMAGRLAEVGGWSVDLPAKQVVWSDVLAHLHDQPVGYSPSVAEALQYYVPEHRDLMTQSFQDCVSDGTPFDVEHEIITAHGRRIWVRAIGEAVRDDAGSIVRIQGALQDLSERKAIEQETRLLATHLSDTNAKLEGRVLSRTSELDAARVEAEQANRAKSAFLATMSHEIRTPMNGVIGMIDVLHRTGLSAPQVEMVDLIRDSADTLLKIIEDILDFSKIEAGKLVLEHHSMRLVEVVEKVCAMLAPVALGRNVVMSIFVDPDLPPLVLGDELRLRQVLMNLVGNAIKFSSGQERPGRVVIRAMRVAPHDIESTDPDSPVVVDMSVSDNGIGMDRSTVARLFVPFSQADASTTRRFGGSGLGLAISSTLVRLMGGTISVRSKPGAGSTFALRLGFDEPAATAIAHRSSGWGDSQPGGLDMLPSKEARAALPILVAEDNETNRKVIVLQLDLLGFRAVVAVDGRDALERWRNGRFSLLLTDLHMPHMDGYALASAIRTEEPRGVRLPIVALTANALRDEELRCLAGGMDAYLSKPVRLPQLKRVIESWIGPAAPGPRADGTPDESSDAVPPEMPADLNVLRALIGDDPVILRNVVDAFRTSATKSAVDIQQGRADSNHRLVLEVAHSLKSAARSIGALRLGDLCAELETAALGGDEVELDVLVHDFLREVDKVRAYLDTE